MARYWRTVDAGFGTVPPADPAVWTRLSGVDRNPVIDFTGTRTCRNKSAGEAEAGTSQIVLLGDNGWLDPTNPNGPYFGNLVPGCPIRSRLTDGTSFWASWRGFVRRWPMSESAKPGQHAVIDCYDSLGWLGGVSSPYPSDLYRAIMVSGPSGYWPHDDPKGQVVRDVIAGFDGGISGPAALSGPSLTVEGAGVSASFTQQPDSFVAATSATVMPRPPFSVTMLIRVLSIASGAYLPQFMSTSAASVPGATITGRGVWVWDGVAGAVRWAFWDGGAGGAYLAPGDYLLTMTYDLAGNLSAWVDGTMAQRAAGAYQDPLAYTAFKWGAALGLVAPGNSSAGCEIAHVALWPRVLADAEIIGLSAAAHTARSGERVDQRLNYLADQVGWPAGLRNFAVATQNVGPVRMDAPMLDLFRRAVALEDGTLTAAADGTVVFYARNGDPASSFTVGGSAAPKQSAVYSTSEATVITAAEVGNPPAVVTAGGGIVGGRTAKIDQLTATFDDAWLAAQRLVQLGGSPRPGIDAVTLDPVDTPAALGLDLAATGTVARRPRWSGVDVVEPYQITSITDTGGGGNPAKRTFSLLRTRPVQRRLNCTNANPTGATTPHVAAYNPAGAVTLEALSRLANWSAASTQILVAHGSTNTTFNYEMYLSVSSGLCVVTFGWFDNANTFHSLAATAFARTGARYLWTKVTFTPSTGTAVFYLSASNRYSYTTWGTVTFGATTIRAVTGPMQLGGLSGAAAPLVGDILQASVSSGATVVASFDPTADNQPGTSTWVSGTGETWALQGTGSLIAS